MRSDGCVEFDPFRDFVSDDMAEVLTGSSLRFFPKKSNLRKFSLSACNLVTACVCLEGE